MSGTIILELDGTLESEIRVKLEIKKGIHFGTERVVRGHLPSQPNLLNLYQSWQSIYREFYRDWGSRSQQTLSPQPYKGRALTSLDTEVTHYSEQEFRDICDQLKQQINVWLGSELFQNINRQMYQAFISEEEIHLIIETNDKVLRQLPWQLWRFFDDYPRAELALSTQEYGAIKPQSKTPDGRVRILAVFGEDEDLDIGSEQAAIEALPDAEAVCLNSPNRRELDQKLWDKQGWDILFFAGHSHSDLTAETGQIRINDNESLSLSQLKNALNRALTQGLTLAVFNSCDGLGLAWELSHLNIPQMIVMREFVPDLVAQEFFKHFLEAYSAGQSIYSAVRDAREQLQGLESQFPCATWLPVICQNPTLSPQNWAQLLSKTPKTKKLSLSKVLITSVAVGACIIGIRQTGMLQPFELWAYDFLMQQKSNEDPDGRFLIIDVAKKSNTDTPGPGADSLPDSELLPLLNKLSAMNPRSIGLDIFRDGDQKALEKSQPLVNHLESDNFFGICQYADDQNRSHSDVAAPPKVHLHRQGFSDNPHDSGYIFRRSLLASGQAAADESKCKAVYSLSAQLAMHYIASENKEVSFPNDLILDKTAIPRFPDYSEKHPFLEVIRSNKGGYYNVDNLNNGYQVLLNYRKHPKVFPSIELDEFMSADIEPGRVKDKIVLIGVTDTSFGDYHLTPISNPEAMPGVFLQAQATSQLISAAQNNRPLMSCWPLWGEWIWILGWTGIGSLIIWIRRSRLYVIFGTALLLGFLLYHISLRLFILGFWVPLIPAGLACFLSGIIAILIFNLPVPSKEGHIKA